jgi:hypothetical protein
MATAKELRVWADMVRKWATKMDEIWAADLADSLAAEMDRLAARREVSERQFV